MPLVEMNFVANAQRATALADALRTRQQALGNERALQRQQDFLKARPNLRFTVQPLYGPMKYAHVTENMTLPPDVNPAIQQAYQDAYVFQAQKTLNRFEWPKHELAHQRERDARREAQPKPSFYNTNAIATSFSETYKPFTVNEGTKFQGPRLVPLAYERLLETNGVPVMYGGIRSNKDFPAIKEYLKQRSENLKEEQASALGQTLSLPPVEPLTADDMLKIELNNILQRISAQAYTGEFTDVADEQWRKAIVLLARLAPDMSSSELQSMLDYWENTYEILTATIAEKGDATELLNPLAFARKGIVESVLRYVKGMLAQGGDLTTKERRTLSRVLLKDTGLTQVQANKMLKQAQAEAVAQIQRQMKEEAEYGVEGEIPLPEGLLRPEAEPVEVMSGRPASFQPFAPLPSQEEMASASASASDFASEVQSVQNVLNSLRSLSGREKEESLNILRQIEFEYFYAPERKQMPANRSLKTIINNLLGNASRNTEKASALRRDILEAFQ